MLRRLLSIALATTVLLVFAATPAFAAGPDRSRLGPYAVDIPAGQVCDFALHLAVTDAHATTITFPVDRRGDQLVQMVGQETVVATNSDDDISVTIQEGVRISLVYRADSTIDQIVDGIAIAWYFSGDVGGRSLRMYVGRIYDTYTAGGQAISHSSVGRSRDLCAELAP